MNVRRVFPTLLSCIWVHYCKKQYNYRKNSPIIATINLKNELRILYLVKIMVYIFTVNSEKSSEKYPSNDEIISANAWKASTSGRKSSLEKLIA